MADYILLYQGGDPNWKDQRTPEEMQTMMQEWGAWFKELEASGSLRNPGAPLHPEGAALRRDGDGFATDTTMAEVKEIIGGYSVIAADSLEEATSLAEGCPFLNYHPGGAVVVRPVMPMPEG